VENFVVCILPIAIVTEVITSQSEEQANVQFDTYANCNNFP